MDERYVTEQVMNEFAKRVDIEDKRQNERLEALEKNYSLVNNLYVSVERLATNMEAMAKELSRQGECLKVIESQPAKRWDLVVTSIITGIAGAVIGMMLKGWMP